MAGWTIYKKDGTERMIAVGGETVSLSSYVEPQLQLAESWMGECTVTLTVKSPVPVTFAFGDYVVYRGERYVIADPSVKKNARRSSRGDGFTYGDIKFRSLGSSELPEILFRDYVLGDNHLHYSSLPKFSFYAQDVEDLADRLQANTDLWCASNGFSESDYWLFVTPNFLRTVARCSSDALKAVARERWNQYFADSSRVYGESKVEQNVDVDHISVYDGLRFIKDVFGMSFVTSGRCVAVGVSGLPTSKIFRYGKGNGLYEIERVADSSQQVVTKLFAYGSDKNLPLRYYADVNVRCYATASSSANYTSFVLLDIDWDVDAFNTPLSSGLGYSVQVHQGSGNSFSATVFPYPKSDGKMITALASSQTIDAASRITFDAGVNADKWDGQHRYYTNVHYYGVVVQQVSGRAVLDVPWNADLYTTPDGTGRYIVNVSIGNPDSGFGTGQSGSGATYSTTVGRQDTSDGHYHTNIYGGTLPALQLSQRVYFNGGIVAEPGPYFHPDQTCAVPHCFANVTGQADAVSLILLALPWNPSAFSGIPRNYGYDVGIEIGMASYSAFVQYYAPAGGDKTLMVLSSSVVVSQSERIYFVSGIYPDRWDSTKKEATNQNMPNNMAVNFLMLPGFPTYSLAELCRCSYDAATDKTVFEIRKTPQDAYKVFLEVDGNHPVSFSDDRYDPYLLSGNADVIGIKEGTISFTEQNDDNGLKEIYPSIEGMTAGDIDGSTSEDPIDVLYASDMMTDNGVVAEGEKEPADFDLVLKDVGFNLRQAFANAGDQMTISMRDGYCGGRDFSVKSVNEGTGGRWKCRVSRHKDDLLKIYFPYSSAASLGGTPVPDEPYQLRAGDHFVITGIYIQDTSYIWAASMKMLRKSILWLLANDYTRYTYQPKIDEIFMARDRDDNGQRSLHYQLHAGCPMLFEDTDLGIDGSVFIDSLRIKEYGNGTIPTYDVTLREDKQVGTLQRLKNNVSTLTSGGGGAGGGGLTIPDVRSLIETYGAELFLSKAADDIAQGIIGFTKGLWVKAKGLFGIDEQGDARLRNATMQGDVVSDNFQSGWEGSGYALIKDADGVSRLEVDELMIRRKLMAREVEIQRETYIGGLISVGDADGTIYKMVPYTAGGAAMNVTVYVIGGVAIGVETDTNKIIALDKTAGTAAWYRCYFVRSDDETKVKNRWKVGDMARCDEWELDKRHGEDADVSGNRFYWRLVINTGTEMLTDADGVEREYIFIDLAAGYSEQLYSWPAVNGDCYVTQTGTPPSPISPQPPIYGYPVMVWPSAVNSDIPAVGDHVVQNGYVNDERPNRQSIIKIGYNGSVDGTKEFNVFEGIGADKTSAATQYSYPSNPVKIGSAGTSITAKSISLKTGSGSTKEVHPYMGVWVSGTTAYNGEEWTYNGQVFVCVTTNTSGTGTTPSTTSSEWELKIAKGRDGANGHDGTSFTAKGKVDGVWADSVANFIDAVQTRKFPKMPDGIWAVVTSSQTFASGGLYQKDGTTVTELTLTTGDAYVMKGHVWDHVNGDDGEQGFMNHLFSFSGTVWVDLGDLQGTDGESGLTFSFTPTALVITEAYKGDWNRNVPLSTNQFPSKSNYSSIDTDGYYLDGNKNRIPVYEYSFDSAIVFLCYQGDTTPTYYVRSVSLQTGTGISAAWNGTTQAIDITLSQAFATTDYERDQINMSVTVGATTYALSVPIIINRAGQSYVRLERGLVEFGVKEIDRQLSADGIVTETNWQTKLLLTAKNQRLFDYVNGMLAAGWEVDAVNSFVNLIGHRMQFFDTSQGGLILRTFFEGGLMNVVNPITNRTQIEFGLDENNNAVLKYYDAQGNYLYNLGPDGLQMLGSQALGMRTRRMGGVSYENIVADVYRNDPHIILKCVAWACADDLQTIVKSSCYEMQFKEAAGVYVLVSANQAQQVEITDYDHNTTYQETITPEYDITKENGELYDHKWLDSNISTPQAVIGIMGLSGTLLQEHLLRSEGYAFFRNVFVDDSFDVYHGEGVPTDYIPPSQDDEMVIYCKGGVERNYTEVNFSQTVYVRRLRYFIEGLEVAHLDIYFNM